MLLLFVPEFASEQFTRIIRDLAQPLLQRLALFTIDAVAGRAHRWSGVVFIPQLAARDVIGAGFRRGFALLVGVRRGLLVVGFRFAIIRRLSGRTRRRFLRGGSVSLPAFLSESTGGGVFFCLSKLSTSALLVRAGRKSG